MKGSVLIAFFFFLLLLSCNKTESSKKLECEDFLSGSRAFETSYSIRRISATVNPLNENLIAYVKFNSNSSSSIYTYNSTLNSETIILENTMVYGQPIWSSDGNIYFINQDYSIIKLDPNTKNHQTIFGNMGIIAFLSISPNGQNLIFQTMSVPELQSIIIDPNGSIIRKNTTSDTTGKSIVYIAGSWLNDSLILSLDTNEGISVINMNTSESSPIVKLETNTFNFDKIYASKSGQFCFIAEYNVGLWRIDLNSKEYILVDEMCLFSEYGFISNYTDNEIIISQKKCYAYDYRNLTCNEDLLIMDINSGMTKPLFK